MKFGVCSASKLVKGVGADYSELPASTVSAMEREEYSELLRAVRNGEIITYSCNGLVPGSVRITGDINKALVREYVDKTFYRLKELGISILVFGSGAAKNVPEGFSMEKAWDQILEFGHFAAECAGKYGQTIAVEPLCYAEANIINTLEDGARYVNAINRDSFKLLADFYHVNQNKEDLSELEKYKDLLVHVHIAGLKRGIPETEEDKEYVKSCIRKLKEIGYNGNVSYEGAMTDDLAGVGEMINLFREV